MNLNDFFSNPSHVKEAYTNNYPSSTPAADATAAVSSGKAIDDPDIMGSLRSASEPKFDRFSKTGGEPKFDFRTGLDVGDEEDTEFMAEPNKYVQSWTPKSSIAPNGWRYVEKDEDPARYSSGPAAASPSSKSASAGGLPKMRFDIASQRLVPVDQPIALDLSPKNSDIKSGSNPNIDADTRARALDWAKRLKAPAAALAGSMNSSGAPVDVKATPAAAPAVAPVASLKDLPVEKPGSWKDIAQANNIANPNRIMPGQVLKIPGKADYVVQAGDTLAGIAAGQTKAPKYTPTPGQDPSYAAALEKLKKYPNLGTLAPLPLDMQKDLGTGPITTKTYDPFGKEINKKVGREEILTPAMIQQQKQADDFIAGYEKKQRDRAAAQANRKKTNEDDIDDQTQVSSVDRDWSDNNDHHYSSTSFQQDPNNPANNSYMDQQDHNGVASTTYARNVTPKWMSNLKSTAGVPGAEPAAQPPSQYPTQAGQGMNNKPFAAYSTPPGQKVTRESLDRIQSLAGIRKK